MNKLYNTQSDFVNKFNEFLSISNINNTLRKTQINILPYIIWGLINAESSVSLDIAKHLKGQFSDIQFDSIVKRIRRFFNNKLFNPYDFFDNTISYVIDNYKCKHKDNTVHIIIDHMFSHDNYTVLMFSMRIGKQGIPIWFKCFKGQPSDAFKEALIKEGISQVSKYFENKNYKLIFLGDRFFDNTNLMKYIQSLNHFFCFRVKSIMRVLYKPKSENHLIWMNIKHLPTYKYHSVCYKDILITRNKYKCNIVISKTEGTDDPWNLATNLDYKLAISSYNKRFGAIETIFKNQKSNGFRIETINNASLKYFTTMYSLVCFSTLFLTILGADFNKNTDCYKNVKIETHKHYKNKGIVRVMSLFKTGLTLFKIAINNHKYIRIPFKMILYDI